MRHRVQIGARACNLPDAVVERVHTLHTDREGMSLAVGGLEANPRTSRFGLGRVHTVHWRPSEA